MCRLLKLLGCLWVAIVQALQGDDQIEHKTDEEACEHCTQSMSHDKGNDDNKIVT